MQRAKHTCVFRTKATGTSREATWVTIARISSTWLHNSFSINFCLLCIQKYFSVVKLLKNPQLSHASYSLRIHALRGPLGLFSQLLLVTSLSPKRKLCQSFARGHLGPRSPEADPETRLCAEVTFAVSPPEELIEERKGAAEEGRSPSQMIAHAWWEVHRETTSPMSLSCIKTRTLTQVFILLHQEVLAWDGIPDVKANWFFLP